MDELALYMCQCEQLELALLTLPTPLGSTLLLKIKKPKIFYICVHLLLLLLSFTHIYCAQSYLIQFPKKKNLKIELNQISIVF